MNSQRPDNDPSMPDPMIERARSLFDQAGENLDTATSNRLRLMRRDALQRPRRRMPHRWFPIAAAAVTILGIGLTWWLPQRNAAIRPTATPTVAADAELLPEDDTEIYDWLGDAPVATDDGEAGSQ